MLFLIISKYNSPPYREYYHTLQINSTKIKAAVKAAVKISVILFAHKFADKTAVLNRVVHGPARDKTGLAEEKF